MTRRRIADSHVVAGARKRRAAIVAVGRLAPDLRVTGVAYTMQQVNEAERRIRAECPYALINRGNYDWTLIVARPDKSEAFVVFDTGRDPFTVLGDVDAIIRALKE